MILHPDIMIYELLELYFKITNDNIINIPDLQAAFLTLQNIINTEENQYFDYDFNEIFNNFCNEYSDYLDIFNNNLIINEDLVILLDAILEKYKYYSALDQTICLYIENINIFKALNLDIPHQEMQTYFLLNKEIIDTYSNIAELESLGIKNNLIIYYLKKLVTQLISKLTKLDETDLLKIKICCADLNTCLSSDCDIFENSAWFLTLFSNDSSSKSKINYAKLEYLTSELSFLLDDFDDEENIDSNNLKEALAQSIDTEDQSELSIFLSYFFIELTNYLENNDLDPSIKKELIMKKYLLLSTPELHKIEEYYLKTSNLVTNLPPIEPEYYAKSTFDIFLATIHDCIYYLDYSNIEIQNNPEIYSNIIINALFIKNFFNLSLNEKAKNEFTNLIVTQPFYNLKKDYSIAINIIDEIIFHNAPHLGR